MSRLSGHEASPPGPTEPAPESGGPAGRSRRTRYRTAVIATLAAVGVTLGPTTVTQETVDLSGYADRCLAVGAAVNGAKPAMVRGPALFRHAQRELGPLSIRRSFNSSLPPTFSSSAGGGDAAIGVRSFVSWKPPNGDHRGAAAGKYDRQITAWAESVPRTGVYATSFHEPENDMTAAEFVAFQRHVYTVVKAANPTIHWGPVYMAYWWDPAEPSHYVGNPAAWWPGDGYADFVGLDWYAPKPHPMTTSGSFLTWYDTMLPTGLPLFITEYGQYAVSPGERRTPAMDRARAEAIRQDAAWIADHSRIRMWLYWQGFGKQGDWRLTDTASQAAWQAVADRGCTPGPFASAPERAAG